MAHVDSRGRYICDWTVHSIVYAKWLKEKAPLEQLLHSQCTCFMDVSTGEVFVVTDATPLHYYHNGAGDPILTGGWSRTLAPDSMLAHWVVMRDSL